MTCEDTKNSIDDRREHLINLAALLRDFEETKLEVEKLLNNAETIATSAEGPTKHFNVEEVKRHLTKHQVSNRKLLFSK